MRKKRFMIIAVALVVCAVAAITGLYVVKKKEAMYMDLPVSRVLAEVKGYSEKGMYEDADLIVIGYVKTNLWEDVKNTTDTKYMNGIVTYTTFHIDIVLKGEYDKPTLNLLQLTTIRVNTVVPEQKGQKFRVAIGEYDELKKDNIYILYLARVLDKQIKNFGFPLDSYVPLGAYHGVVDLCGEIRSDAKDDLGYYGRMSSIKRNAIKRFRDEIREVTGLEIDNETRW